MIELKRLKLINWHNFENTTFYSFFTAPFFICNDQFTKLCSPIT